MRRLKSFCRVIAFSLLTQNSIAQETTLGLSDSVELEAFFDGMLETHLDVHRIAGATVSVVKDGEIFFMKGYGYADLENKMPVSPEETLFRIGSISKLFVWISVMQLVEQGKLDLDADVNDYLADFQIPAAFDKPITMKNLMTHTPGFEDYVLGLFAKDESSLAPLGEILKRELPARVRPAGDVGSYSNHGTGMAAYIVEQISGMAWDDYVEKNILEPLGLTRTTFRQPVPEALADGLSKGYTWGGGEFHEEGFEFVPLAPVGAASATAKDMATFMIANLQNGRLGETTILDSATSKQMHSPLFRHAPELNSMTHGFMDVSRNGHWIIGHGGDTFWFHSVLGFLPEYNVGLFLSYNSDGGGGATQDVYRAFIDRYFPPEETPELSPDENAAKELQKFAGTYRGNRFPHKRLTKLAALFGTVDLAVSEDGELVMSGSEKTYWVQTKPLVFHERGGVRKIAFRENENGEITHLFLGEISIIAFEKVSGLDAPGFHNGLAVFAIILFSLTVIFWATAALVRRRQGAELDPQTSIPALARFLAWAASALLLIFIFGMAVVLSNPNDIVYGIPMSLKILLVFPILAAALSIGVLIYTVFIWMFGKGRVLGRVYYTILSFTLIAFIWQLHYWNLLGYRY